jgi:RND family efflux transporter MFP subunit
MSQTKPSPEAPAPGQQAIPDVPSPSNDSRSIERRLRLLPVIGTFLVATVAAGAVWILWQEYMGTPWTRDGTVRAYIVTLAPEVSGRIVELDVRDNQYVHAGDMLMKIDPRDYKIAVDLGKAAVDQAQADYDNKKLQAERRVALSDLATSIEARQSYTSSAAMALAALEQQKANLERATVNLARTEIRSPVTGWVTNLLLARVGDYAATGETAMSLVDADSFWVDGYFEETALRLIHDDDPASIWLLGYREVLQGHVEGVARGIVVSNATPGKSGLATVNPIFTWVRLPQRIPVRMRLDTVPPDVRLVVGMTATIEIHPKPAGGSGTSPAIVKPNRP